MSTELYPLNCRYICDARPKVDVDVLPAPDTSIKVSLACPWMDARKPNRPVKITVSTNEEGKTTAFCDEVRLCHNLHVYLD